MKIKKLLAIVGLTALTAVLRR